MSIECLALVVPCLNEERSVGLYLDAMSPVIDNLRNEGLAQMVRVVFVDDGSTDATLAAITHACELDGCIAYVSFSRNFGKEAALLAGMEKALALGASHVAVMDVDLQDPPELLPQMARRMEQTGCDVIATYRSSREGEPPIRSWFAHRFYELMSSISEVEMRDGARDFRLMTRRVVESVVRMPETQRFSKGLFAWSGFSTEWIGYENRERAEGQTSWSFFSLVAYAIDGVVAFSVAPLRMLSILGMFVSFLALLLLLFIYFRALLFGDPVAGWPSMVCIITLFSGLQLLGMGVLGMYLSKTYAEVKRRPMYVIAEES